MKHLAIALVLAASGAAAQSALYECAVDGRPSLWTGPAGAVAPEGCDRLPSVALDRAEPDLVTLVRRLDRQEAELRRLADEVDALSRQAGVLPAARTPAMPRGTSGLEAQSAQRFRDLGQDIDRKLDDLSGTWDR